MPRGGYRKPSQPAAVSGPGALSQRTDGGAGQPIRVAPGGDYGDRQAMEQQQGAAPMRSGGIPIPPPGGGEQPAGPPPSPLDVFGPTERPGEPQTSGVPIGPGDPGMPDLLPEDPYEFLRVLASIDPHPDVLELLQRGGL